ncbi:hypothetical protein SADUNF_Sadunf09G0096700 [Salix dunnii]|uniref:Uncharacterized protein n=1 Tax=Salix dunnii TaxID=1413687 RepID=A0A835JRA3_9ROSI|nr:hypothetical protein SADUNF_Sadunf09G0096700 [Salix dunnii]
MNFGLISSIYYYTVGKVTSTLEKRKRKKNRKTSKMSSLGRVTRRLPGKVDLKSPQPNFYKKIKNDKGSDFGPCFITGILRNFYERLFPNNVSHPIFNGVHRLAIPEVLL